MAAAKLAVPSSIHLYQQAISLLEQHKFDLAFVAAKQALDGASSVHGQAYYGVQQVSDGALLLHSARCWLALAQASAGMQDIEVAYCLYAKGYAHCNSSAMEAVGPNGSSSNSKALSQQQQRELAELVQQLSVGRLEMLAALCQVPQQWQWQQQQQQQAMLDNQQASSSSSSLLSLSVTAASGASQQQQHQLPCKRFQRMLDRFLDVGSSSSSSTFNSSSSSNSRVFCVSDLHVDQAGGANLAWLKRISRSAFRNDVIIVAGDVGDTCAAVAAAFRELAPRFRRVVWVPGNHEAWIRRGSRDETAHADSFAKLLALRQVADEFCVDVGPVEVTPGLMVVPLMSWYSHTFDTADPRPGRYRHDSFCRWPVADSNLWQVMMKLNSPVLALVDRRLAQLTQQQQQQQQQQQAADGYQEHGSAALSTEAAGGNCGQQPPVQQLATGAAAYAVNLSKQLQQSQQQSCSYPTGSTWAGSSSNSSSNNSSNSSSNSSSSVIWNTQGFLAVKAARPVPGLQLNLTPQPRRAARQPLHDKQQMQPAAARVTAAATAAAATGQQTVQLQEHVASTKTPAVVTAPQPLQNLSSLAAAALSVPPSHQKPATGLMWQATSATAAAAAATAPAPVAAAAAATAPATPVAPATSAAPAAVPAPAAAVAAPAAAAPVVPVTVITVSHFLPHPKLPHPHMTELAKAMGCCELQMQLEQVSSVVHVYGHSHINTDTVLDTPPATLAACSTGTSQTPGRCYRSSLGLAGLRCGTAGQGSGWGSQQDDNSRTGSSSSSSSNRSSTAGLQRGQRRYVQYALDAVGASAAGVCCIWDGSGLARPGSVVQIA